MTQPERTDPNYCLEWFCYLHLQNLSEIANTELIPCYEHRCKHIATCVFEICKQLCHDQDVGIEVKFLALQFFEKLIEEGNCSGDSEDVIYDIISCVQLAVKVVSSITLIRSRDIQKILPKATSKVTMAKEKIVLLNLAPHLGRPSIVSYAEALLSCIGLVQPSDLDRFMSTFDLIMTLFKMNACNLLCAYVANQIGPCDHEEAIFMVRVMYRDQILLASSVIVVTAYFLNLNVSEFLQNLSDLTKLHQEVMADLANLIIRGIAQEIERLSTVQDTSKSNEEGSPEQPPPSTDSWLKKRISGKIMPKIMGKASSARGIKRKSSKKSSKSKIKY